MPLGELYTSQNWSVPVSFRMIDLPETIMVSVYCSRDMASHIMSCWRTLCGFAMIMPTIYICVHAIRSSQLAVEL